MIYVHIPYCHHRCTYCAFYSQAGHRDEMAAYADAVCKEIALRKDFLGAGHPIKTLYFGGGTPTLLPINLLQQIVGFLKESFDLSQLEEATIEANPENLTPDYLDSLHGIGLFNRISIGIQSFGDADLRLTNRIHTANQAVSAVENAWNAGFTNISADLIYGIPGQSLPDWDENLRIAADLPIKHLSCYSLTVEEGSMLQQQMSAGRVPKIDEDTAIAAYEHLLKWAADHGFEQYEISNFAKPGFHSKHNSRYWDRTPYLGLGAAAHSFSGNCRRWNIANAQQYIRAMNEGVCCHEEERLSPTQAANEYLMTALRTTKGIEWAVIDAMCSEADSKQIGRALNQCQEQGLLTFANGFYAPTHDGLLMADAIAIKIML